MTEQEIANLNERVAIEVLGWRKSDIYNGSNKTGEWCWLDIRDMRRQKPDFLTSISHAWEVVEHLLPNHALRGFGYHRFSGMWCASFWPSEVMAAPTAPLAICMAAFRLIDDKARLQKDIEEAKHDLE